MALKNPAFYDPTADRIVCGTDLQRLGEDLAQFRAEARQLLDELAKNEADVIRVFGKKPDQIEGLPPVRDGRAMIGKVAKENEEAFDRATRQAFQTLYHESFHAYVGSFVFPPGKGPGELPRWLNEGLAQVFETAVFEAGELHLGRADKVRLDKAQEALKKGEFPAVTDILTAGPTGSGPARRPAAGRGPVGGSGPWLPT